MPPQVIGHPASKACYLRLRGLFFLCTFIALLIVPATTHSSLRQVAIIVHPENNVSNLSRSELERIFHLRRQRWSDGQRIYLLMQEEGSVAKDIVLRKIYHMRSDELKRFWLAKIYRGEMISFPKSFQSDESVRRFVSLVRNSIGFIDASHSQRSVKVLRIDRLLPGQEGYLLTLESE